MKTVVITGGAGFVGSHLCDRFMKEGFQVWCLDNLCTGRYKNIKHLIEFTNFHFIQSDVSTSFYIPSEIDYILHFASPASPVDYLRLPIRTMAAGSTAVFNALDLAKSKGARFLLASTSEVYGDPLEHPQREDYWGHVNPNGPRSVYDEAKRFAEALTMAYHRTYGIETRIVRIFNTYGPRMRLGDGRALPTFFKQALSNEPLTLYGDGSQTRSFTYIDDLVEGVFRLLVSDETDPVNIGNPEEVTLLQTAMDVIDVCESKSEIVCKPLPEDDPKKRCPDIGKAQDVLGWTPQVCRMDGLHKIVEHFRSELR